ncbi:hypothetical protein CLOSCI_03016 [[Clostridium] scindens ATCC 35704]|nr:Unknown Function [uncultured bacterium]APO31405.1 Unknown Function [uncultured bacterium]APO31492.1 Unknown Function [uncultured bacterium]APO32267.1 Unknown Function [uncultured bacterium]EDS05889.1 hypothetical protein CLOSCI_03016 [[Clostridium] scindens ATCC 35704]
MRSLQRTGMQMIWRMGGCIMRSTYQTKKECFGKDENGNPASDKTSLMILVAEKHKLEICGG